MFDQPEAHIVTPLVKDIPSPSPAHALDDLFLKNPALGPYAKIEVELPDATKIQIVIDQHMSWLEEALKRFFKIPVTKLTLKQISDFIAGLRSMSSAPFNLAEFLGLAPHRNLENTNSVQVFYLDDIAYSKTQRSLILSLLTQTLIEKYTARDSRIVKIEERHQKDFHVGYVILVKSQIEGYQVLDPALEFKNLGAQTFFSRTEKSTFQGAPVSWIVRNSEFTVFTPETVFDERSKTVSIVTGGGDELSLSVLGRTPAEKRFKAEEIIIRNARPNDFVPIEIAFHPFWRRLGHTTLRIGDSLYELSSKGWKVHGGQGTSARAYLFNNPFFKEQFKLYSPSGMSPASIGVTLEARKSHVEKIQVALQNLVSAKGKEREKFNLYWNNCNQGLMRVMTEAGLTGFSDRGYLGFSAVLSFRQVLLNPPLKRIGIYLYPLPGTDISESQIRKWVPRLLYRHNSTKQEVARAIPSLYWDAVVFWAKRISDVIYKFTKMRLWKGHDGYQYLNT